MQRRRGQGAGACVLGCRRLPRSLLHWANASVRCTLHGMPRVRCKGRAAQGTAKAARPPIAGGSVANLNLHSVFVRRGPWHVESIPIDK